jgi:hypothetical protein
VSVWPIHLSSNGNFYNIPVEVFVAHQTQHAAASATALACQDTTAEVCQVPLVALNALAHFLRPLLAFCEVGFYLLPMTQIVGNDRINIR